MQIRHQKTTTLKKKQINRHWHLLDGQDEVLGQLATQIVELLIGKHKPTYTPNIDDGDYVVVINASKVVVTGNKADKKIYTHHSNYPGGLVSESFRSLQDRDPETVIRLAVKRMLPANKLRDVRLDRLKVFPGAQHTYQNFIKE